MKFFTQISAAFFAVAACFGANAQTADNNTMYLIKGDRVVSKYDVDAVDYVSFKLPEGVRDEALWLDVDKVGKNSVSYTVNTTKETTAYAHGLISYYDVNYLAMDYFGDMLENLEEAEKLQCLQAYLMYTGYMGIGSTTYNMTDYADDGARGKFSVRPGNNYYICAWEIDPSTQEPLETFVYQEITTENPGESTATLTVDFVRQNEEGLAFDIQGSSDIVYVVTCYGIKSVMDIYAQTYGQDFLLGTFGQTYELSQLQGEGEMEGIEAATWPAYEAGEYVLYVRGYDAKGDIVDAKCYATAEGSESKGPEINIFSKTKGDGKVSVNFEISPSNVSEAYVRLIGENELDDKLNDGWLLYEVASDSKSIDIVDTINSTGEYTFNADGLDEMWYSILIYARDKEGARTTQRINFFPDFETDWSIYDPVYKAPRKSLKVIPQSKSRKPAIDRVK